MLAAVCRCHCFDQRPTNQADRIETAQLNVNFRQGVIFFFFFFSLSMSWARLIIYHKSAAFGILLAVYLKFKFNWASCVFICYSWQLHQSLSLPLNSPHFSSILAAPEAKGISRARAWPRAESQALGTSKASRVPGLSFPFFITQQEESWLLGPFAGMNCVMCVCGKRVLKVKKVLWKH